MADEGFLKTFFKLLKEGRKTGAIHNVFITGVLPITIDELASGFNISRFITLEPAFENMLGFTQAEVDRLLDDIYEDYQFDPSTRAENRCGHQKQTTTDIILSIRTENRYTMPPY